MKNVMVNVSSVTHMCVHALLCEYAMNAIMDLIKVAVLFVGDQVYLMLITVKSVQFRRKIEMDAQRLST